MSTKFEQEFLALNQVARPIDWSSVRGHLASKLMFASSMIIDQSVIDQQKKTFEQVDKDKSPEEWSRACYDLANGLHACAQQEDAPSVTLLNESLESYKKVLMVWSRDEKPKEWASTFNNLGMVFMSLGERTLGKRSLEKSVAAFKNAIAVRGVNDAPQEWAICQNNMGVSFRILAELSQNVDMLKDSIDCYEGGLDVLSVEHSPIGWVMTTANLGDARIMLANQLDDGDIAQKAIDDFSRISEYFQSLQLVKQIELAKDHQEKAEKIKQHIENN